MSSQVATPKQSSKGLALPRQQGRTNRQVPMSWYRPGGMYATWAASNREDLWTESIEDCMTIATINVRTGARSLMHAQGGAVTDGYYDDLAQYLDNYTYIVVSNGRNWSDPTYMRDHTVADVAAKVRAALNRRGMRTVRPTVLMYFTRADRQSRNVRANTFALLVDGTYGRLGAPVDVPATSYHTAC